MSVAARSFFCNSCILRKPVQHSPFFPRFSVLFLLLTLTFGLHS